MEAKPGAVASTEWLRSSAVEIAPRIDIHCSGTSPADFDEAAVEGEPFWEGQQFTTTQGDAIVGDPDSVESPDASATPLFRAVRAKSVHACCANEAAAKQLSELRLHLGESQAAAARATAATAKLKQERDSQRIHTKRLAQEKNQLLAELRSLQQKSAQVQCSL